MLKIIYLIIILIYRVCCISCLRNNVLGLKLVFVEKLRQIIAAK